MKRYLLAAAGILSALTLGACAYQKSDEETLMSIERTSTEEETKEESSEETTEEETEEEAEEETEEETTEESCPYQADADGNEEVTDKIIVTTVDVKRKPDGKSAVYGQFEAGETVQVLGEAGENWIKVVYNGHIAYIPGSAVENPEETTAADETSQSESAEETAPAPAPVETEPQPAPAPTETQPEQTETEPEAPPSSEEVPAEPEPEPQEGGSDDEGGES